jgi:hypothetical protein
VAKTTFTVALKVTVDLGAYREEYGIDPGDSFGDESNIKSMLKDEAFDAVQIAWKHLDHAVHVERGS